MDCHEIDTHFPVVLSVTCVDSGDPLILVLAPTEVTLISTFVNICFFSSKFHLFIAYHQNLSEPSGLLAYSVSAVESDLLHSGNNVGVL